MKRKITLLVGALSLLSFQNFAQSDLYVGYRGNGTATENELARLDTTGGTIAFVENTTVTTDFAGGMNGLFGMSVHPITGDVYCVYGVDSDVADERRLGIIDLSTASITDIGETGPVIDITFVDTSLFASLGSNGGSAFVTINTATGETTTLFTHGTAHGGSSAINFDYYNNRILRSIQGAATYTAIDVNTLAESSLPHSGHPGWTTSLLTIDDETCYSIGATTINSLNTTSFAFASEFAFPSANWTHSSVFGEYPLSLWVNGNRNMCGGDESILTVVGDGTTYEWFKDGTAIAGATESTYTVTESGDYSVIVDGTILNEVTINVSESIDPGFTISANPAFLEGAADITVGFVANELGAGFNYQWDSGNGESSTLPNPLFTYDAIGSYDVSLTVSTAAGGCPEELTQTLQVAAGASLVELEKALDIYPVPAKNELFIEFENHSNFTVEIIDLAGSVVASQKIVTSGKNSINVEGLESGTYICKIIDEKYVLERKFVKQ